VLEDGGAEDDLDGSAVMNGWLVLLVSDEREGAPVEGKGDGEDDASTLDPASFVDDGLDDHDSPRTLARRGTRIGGGVWFGTRRDDDLAADGWRGRRGPAL
jgi:hypothetical protein